MDKYRKDVFRAALVNHDHRSPRAYALANNLSTTTTSKVWNGDTDITIDKLHTIIAPLGLTLSELFRETQEEVHE